MQGDNKQLTVWWARYCESRGDIKRALACYEKAGDALSIVRIHCYTRNFAAAEEQVCAFVSKYLDCILVCC